MSLFVTRPKQEFVKPSTAPLRLIDRPWPIRRMVLVLAWPVLLQQLLIFSVYISDRFLAGHFQPLPPHELAEAIGAQALSLGSLANASGLGLGPALTAEVSLGQARLTAAKHIAYQSAQTTAHYLAWFIVSYNMFVSVGATALVARFIGAGDQRRAVHVTNQALLLAVVLGFVGTTAAWLGLPKLVHVLQLRGDAAALAVAYLRPLFTLLVFQTIEAAGIACLVGAGDTRTGFFVLGGVALLNVPLGWLLFHGIGPIPRFGFEGIALGTALSHTVGGLAMLVILTKGRAGLHLRPRLLRPEFRLLHRLLRVGVPAGIDSMSAVACQLWFLGIINTLGDTASGAHGIALAWEGLGYLSAQAFATAAMTLVGQNLGAGRPRQASRSGWTAFGIGCAVICFMSLIFYTWASQMFAVFCPDPGQQPIINAGVPVLRLVAFGMPGYASALIFTYALRGAGDSRVPVLFTWIGFLGFRIPLAYWLTSDAVGMGLFGAWLAMCADLWVRGGLAMLRFAGGRWQRTRV